MAVLGHPAVNGDARMVQRSPIRRRHPDLPAVDLVDGRRVRRRFKLHHEGVVARRVLHADVEIRRHRGRPDRGDEAEQQKGECSTKDHEMGSDGEPGTVAPTGPLAMRLVRGSRQERFLFGLENGPRTGSGAHHA